MSELAQRYALALFFPQVPEAEIAAPLEAVMENPPLWNALCSPAIHPTEKVSVIAALPLWQDAARQQRFLCLLAEKGRCNLLPDILVACHELYLQAENIGTCKLSYTRMPTEAQLQQLRKVLCQKHHKKDITFVFHSDPTLLGGFILELEGITYDQSVRGHLHALGHQLKEVHTPCE